MRRISSTNSDIVISVQTERPRDPCNPSPCGANAVCKERNGAGSCVCLPEYFGDPYTGCRPECVTNSDCERTKACLNNKCRDPCPGTCGIHAECRVLNHAPSCYCLPGYTGDPLTQCKLIPSSKHANTLVYYCRGVVACVERVRGSLQMKKKKLSGLSVHFLRCLLTPPDSDALHTQLYSGIV